MRISLYIEHGTGNGVGGAELMMARLASAWSRGHDVELVHHRPPLTRDRLGGFTSDDLSAVAIRCVPRAPEPEPSRHPRARLRSARLWHRELSEGRDLFVACTHWLPPFNHARRGALLVLFPFYVRPQDGGAMAALPWWKQLRHRVYHDVEWKRRMASYDTRISISEFTRRWTRERWHIDTEVVPPPVDTSFPDHPKRAQILSVGRFSTMAHTKKQLEMAEAFRRLVDAGLTGWRYVCVGGLNDRDENHRYFDRVRATLDGYPALVAANLSREAIRQLYAESSLFWHATGYGDDTVRHPELAEHFGIAPVEAMASGCVPLVVDKGGPSEIVFQSGAGIVWNTVHELVALTRRLADDAVLREQLSRRARITAAEYSSDRFISRMSRACGVPLLAPAPAGMAAARVGEPDARREIT